MNIDLKNILEYKNKINGWAKRFRKQEIVGEMF